MLLHYDLQCGGDINYKRSIVNKFFKFVRMFSKDPKIIKRKISYANCVLCGHFSFVVCLGCEENTTVPSESGDSANTEQPMSQTNSLTRVPSQVRIFYIFNLQSKFNDA